MSIRWIRNVQVDGRPTTLEVMLGSTKISDKCYVRVNQEDELWFHPSREGREAILRQGLDMLRDRLKGKQVIASDGSAFGWH